MSCGGGDNDAFAHAVGVIDVNGGGEQIGAGGAVVKGLGAGGRLAVGQIGAPDDHIAVATVGILLLQGHGGGDAAGADLAINGHGALGSVATKVDFGLAVPRIVPQGHDTDGRGGDGQQHDQSQGGGHDLSLHKFPSLHQMIKIIFDLLAIVTIERGKT